MRIIAGKYRGRRLRAFKGAHLRPTTDRVKEVIFNKLMGYIEGAQILDLFAGTGNLSIEALSRGAEKVISVEKNPKSIRIIKDNLFDFKIETGIEVIQKDVFSFLKGSHPQFDVIFIDPPFTQKIADKVMKAVSESGCFHSSTQIIIESSKHETIADHYGSLKLASRNDYGDKFLSFFKPMEPENETSHLPG